MLLIPILIIALTAGYLVFLLLNKDTSVKKHYIMKEELMSDVVSKKRRFEQIEFRIFDSIRGKFGEKYINDISEGVISNGMPAEFLTMSWGYPEKINRESDEKGKKEKWLYRGNRNEATEVVINNNKVQSWKDL